MNQRPSQNKKQNIKHRLVLTFTSHTLNLHAHSSLPPQPFNFIFSSSSYICNSMYTSRTANINSYTGSVYVLCISPCWFFKTFFFLFFICFSFA